jgi:hypothetical protein
MFNGHLDVVGVDGMTHDPWSAESNGQADRIYGRGSSDMKAGIAAMCAAARAGESELDGEIIAAAVADEEYERVSTRSLIERGVRADGRSSRSRRVRDHARASRLRLGQRDDARTRHTEAAGTSVSTPFGTPAFCSRSWIGWTTKNCRRAGMRCSVDRQCTHR